MLPVPMPKCFVVHRVVLGFEAEPNDLEGKRPFSKSSKIVEEDHQFQIDCQKSHGGLAFHDCVGTPLLVLSH